MKGLDSAWWAREFVEEADFLSRAGVKRTGPLHRWLRGPDKAGSRHEGDHARHLLGFQELLEVRYGDSGLDPEDDLGLRKRLPEPVDGPLGHRNGLPSVRGHYRDEEAQLPESPGAACRSAPRPSSPSALPRHLAATAEEHQPPTSPIPRRMPPSLPAEPWNTGPSARYRPSRGAPPFGCRPWVPQHLSRCGPKVGPATPSFRDSRIVRASTAASRSAT